MLMLAHCYLYFHEQDVGLVNRLVDTGLMLDIGLIVQLLD